MATYYVNNVTGSDTTGDGSQGSPWETIGYSTRQLFAGDTLRVVRTDQLTTYDWGDITTTNHRTGTALLPITVMADNPSNRPYVTESATVEIHDFIGLDYWIFDGLVFNNNERWNFANAENIIIRNCTLQHRHAGRYGYGIRFSAGVDNFTIEDCIFDNLRSRPGNGFDFHAIVVGTGGSANNVTVQRCTFRDCSGDGIQIGENLGPCDNWVIKDNLFEVVRPYQYREPITGTPATDPDGWTTVGENGLDMKDGQNFIVEGNTFRGFRPCDGGTVDGSGSPDGAAIVLHVASSLTGTIIRRNRFENCTGGINVNGLNCPTAVAEISNNIFYDIKDEIDEYYPISDDPYAIQLKDYGAPLKIENNTFYNGTPSLPIFTIDGSTNQPNSLTIRNNVFDNGYIRLKNGANPTTMTSNYNLWANQSQSPPAIFTGANDVNDNTTEIAYASDFYPTETSPVNGAGTDAGYSTDYYGNTINSADVDIGAVQYAVPPTQGMKVAMTDFNISATVSDTFDVTISGFGPPKAVLFLSSKATAQNTTTNEFAMGAGFLAIDTTTYANSTQWSSAMCAQHGVTTTAVTTVSRDDALLSYSSGSGTDGCVAFNTTEITDGVRIQNYAGLTPNAAYEVSAVFFGGDVEAWCGTLTNPALTTTKQTVSGVGFEPDVVLVSVSPNSTNGSRNGGIFSFGAAVNDGSDTQRCLCLGSQNGQAASLVNSYIGNTKVGGRVWNDSTEILFTLSDFGIDGFSIQADSSISNAIRMGFLALKFNSNEPVDLFDFEWPTSGNYSKSLSYQPQVGILLSSLMATARNTRADGSSDGTDGSAEGVTVFDGSSTYTMNSNETDGAGTTDSANEMSTSLQIPTYDNSGTPAYELEGTMSTTSTGFTGTLTTHPGSAMLAWGLTIGEFQTNITDVNTTESWDDGDSGLVITGTGFV